MYGYSRTLSDLYVVEGLKCTLSAGTRLGPYEIAAPIGAGGMGEVYAPATSASSARSR